MKCRALSENRNIIWFKKTGETPTQFAIRLNSEQDFQPYLLSNVQFTSDTVQIGTGSTAKIYKYAFDGNSEINGTLFSVHNEPYTENISHTFPATSEAHNYSITIQSAPEFNFNFGDQTVQVSEIIFAANVTDVDRIMKDSDIDYLYIPFSLSNMSSDTFQNCRINKLYYGGTDAQWNTFCTNNSIDAEYPWDASPEISFEASIEVRTTTKIILTVPGDDEPVSYDFSFYIAAPSSINFGDGSTPLTFEFDEEPIGIFTLTSPHVDNYTSGLDAVKDSLIQRLSVIKGELWYQINFGLPLTEKLRDLALFDISIYNIITQHPEVIAVENYTSSLEGRTYTFDCTVKTIYGEDFDLSNFYTV